MARPLKSQESLWQRCPYQAASWWSARAVWHCQHARDGLPVVCVWVQSTATTPRATCPLRLSVHCHYPTCPLRLRARVLKRITEELLCAFNEGVVLIESAPVCLAALLLHFSISPLPPGPRALRSAGTWHGELPERTLAGFQKCSTVRGPVKRAISVLLRWRRAKRTSSAYPRCRRVQPDGSAFSTVRGIVRPLLSVSFFWPAAGASLLYKAAVECQQSKLPTGASTSPPANRLLDRPSFREIGHKTLGN